MLGEQKTKNDRGRHASRPYTPLASETNEARGARANQVRGDLAFAFFNYVAFELCFARLQQQFKCVINRTFILLCSALMQRDITTGRNNGRYPP